MIRTAISATLILLLGHEAFSQTIPPQEQLVPPDLDAVRVDRIVEAGRATTPIVIDGKLTEGAWDSVEPATDFIQVQPQHGQPATQQTEIRVLYDEANLYVGAICYDAEPDNIRISSLERDFSSQNTDLLGFILDTLNNDQSGFTFWVNPAGAQRDTQVDLDGERTNAEWDGVWDVATSIDERGWVAEIVIPFKTLRFTGASQQEWGFNAVRRTRRLNEDSIWTPLPLRVTSITRVSWAGRLTGLEGLEQGRNLKIKPFVIGSGDRTGPAGPSGGDIDAGVDLKYGFTPQLTFDATFRTDFSQVEADEQQVNLTRFNLFFPEKREFFLENQGIFDVASTPGSSANVIPFFSRRIGLDDSGTPIPILGGTRLSGRAGSYDIGMVVMRTEEDDARPADTFVVGRLRKTFRGTSTVGAIFTSRDSTVAGDFNRLYGVDSRLRFFDRKLDVISYFLSTETPDRSERGGAGLLGVAWRGDRLTWTGQYEAVDEDFNPEVGFVRRSAMRHANSNVRWEQRVQNSARMRHYFLEGGADYYTNPRGEVETRLQNAGVGLALQNGAEVDVQVENAFDRLVEPFEIRPGIVLPVGDYDYLRYSVSANTDPSLPISGTLTASAGEFWNGTSRSIDGELNFQPNHHLSVSTTLGINAVELPAGDFTTTLVGTRVLYGFTNGMFLSSFLQYDATINQFSSNTRFRLIHRPLSDLFIVYNERRDTRTEQLIDRALIVKLTNLFDF